MDFEKLLISLRTMIRNSVLEELGIKRKDLQLSRKRSVAEHPVGYCSNATIEVRWIKDSKKKSCVVALSSCNDFKDTLCCFVVSVSFVGNVRCFIHCESWMNILAY